MADSSTLVDRVKIFVESSGTGPFQLGNALPSFRGSEALVDGLTYSYAVESGSDYEVGQGVYVLAVDQLIRAPTLSSNGGAPVSFPANVAVNFTALAADLVAGLAGSGTVTSVQGSGGTTGLTLTGGPITGAGTLTLGGTLGLANGGTSGTDGPTARTALGLGNVDNTSDADKPISTATQTALDAFGLPTGATMVGVGQTTVATITPPTPQASGAVANGIVNDYAALVAARDAAWSANLKTMTWPDGVYRFGTTLELAKDHWTTAPLGDNVKLKYTGSAIAVSLDGETVHPVYGCYKGVFGAQYGFVIEGSATCTKLLEIANFYQGSINADLREGLMGLSVADNIGNNVGAVLVDIKLRISQGNDGPFTTKPLVGMNAVKMFACQCDLTIEHCVDGLKLIGSAANTFYGVVEGNTGSGINVDSGSYRNTFISVFCESNVGRDWDIAGNSNILINCTGVDSGGNRITGDYTLIQGGKFEGLTIDASAAFTVLDGVEITGTFTDNSTTTTIRNCTLGGVVMTDKAPLTRAALTMGTNISDYSVSDPTFAACRGFRTPDGLGQISASLAAGAAIAIGDTIALVPAGFRPATRVMFAGVNVSTNAAVGLTLDSAGNLQTRTAIASGNVVGVLSPSFER